MWEYDSGEIFSTDDYFKDEYGDWIYPTVRERHAAHNQLIEDGMCETEIRTECI